MFRLNVSSNSSDSSSSETFDVIDVWATDLDDTARLLIPDAKHIHLREKRDDRHLSRDLLDYVANHSQPVEQKTAQPFAVASMAEMAFYPHRKVKLIEQFLSVTFRCYEHELKDDSFRATTEEAKAALNTYGLTTSIIANLENATGKKCLAVSTRDDLSETAISQPEDKRCGYSFKTVLTPYEDQLKQNKTPTPVSPQRFVKLTQKVKNKNQQLIQCAQLLKSQFPNAVIVIHFTEDRVDFCQAAAGLLSSGDEGYDQAKPSKKLPPNVFIKIIHHSPKDNIVCQDNNPDFYTAAERRVRLQHEKLQGELKLQVLELKKDAKSLQQQDSKLAFYFELQKEGVFEKSLNDRILSNYLRAQYPGEENEQTRTDLTKLAIKIDSLGRRIKLQEIKLGLRTANKDDKTEKPRVFKEIYRILLQRYNAKNGFQLTSIFPHDRVQIFSAEFLLNRKDKAQLTLLKKALKMTQIVFAESNPVERFKKLYLDSLKGKTLGMGLSTVTGRMFFKPNTLAMSPEWNNLTEQQIRDNGGPRTAYIWKAATLR